MPQTNSTRSRLGRAELHSSVADPLLDTMTFLNEITTRYPAAISFAPGRPYEGRFEPEHVTGYLDAYVAHLRGDLGYTDDQVRTNLFQYGHTSGHIRELVARTLANDEDLDVAPESVVVTVGAQEGLLLLLRVLFAGPNDVLLVASPSYNGITGAARILDIDMVPVPEGEHGTDPETVARVAEEVRASGRRPRAFYVAPDFANPSGTRTTSADRERLLAVSEEHDFLILEDNAYSFFGGDEQRVPLVKRLDRGGRVAYVGSFAKTCFPGARVGYVVADQEVRLDDGSHVLLADELSKVKSFTTVNTAAVSQALIGGMLVTHDCSLRTANESMRAFYRHNRTVLLDELERHFPAARRAELGLHWQAPEGGFFQVVDVPFAADAAALERSASTYEVLWTPMRYFYLANGGERQLRLSISYLHPDQVVEGVRRLAEFIRAETGAHGSNGVSSSAGPAAAAGSPDRA